MDLLPLLLEIIKITIIPSVLGICIASYFRFKVKSKIDHIFEKNYNEVQKMMIQHIEYDYLVMERVFRILNKYNIDYDFLMLKGNKDEIHNTTSKTPTFTSKIDTSMSTGFKKEDIDSIKTQYKTYNILIKSMNFSKIRNYIDLETFHEYTNFIKRSRKFLYILTSQHLVSEFELDSRCLHINILLRSDIILYYPKYSKAIREWQLFFEHNKVNASNLDQLDLS